MGWDVPDETRRARSRNELLITVDLHCHCAKINMSRRFSNNPSAIGSLDLHGSSTSRRFLSHFHSLLHQFMKLSLPINVFNTSTLKDPWSLLRRLPSYVPTLPSLNNCLSFEFTRAQLDFFHFAGSYQFGESLLVGLSCPV